MQPWAPPPLRIRSPFVHLLVNHEAREVFLQHYPRLFLGSPLAGKKGNSWFFNSQKDSLCIASGLKSLHDLLDGFPADMKTVRYLDIAPSDDTMFQEREPFDWSTCKASLRDLKDLRLVTVRTISPNPNCWESWEQINLQVMKSTLQVLVDALRHEEGRECGSKCVRLAFRYEWVEELWLANPVNYHFAAAYIEFLQAYDPASAETIDRWDEMGIGIWKKKEKIRIHNPSQPQPSITQLVNVLCKMAEIDLHR